MSSSTDFTHGELTIRASRHGSSLLLEWSGRSFQRDSVAVLTPYLSSIVEQAKSSSAEIEMRFNAVVELNSATFSAIIFFLQKAEPIGLPVTIVYDPTLKWQKVNFEALRVFERRGPYFHLRTMSSIPDRF